MQTFSICIPAYKRAIFLAPLLESILSQDFDDYEIIVSEDRSPEREEIKEIVSAYQEKYGNNKIKYFENDKNLGYDGNLRQLIRLAKGKYCFFMGNDDLLKPGALKLVNNQISAHQCIGIVLRSYEWFNETGTEHVVHYCPNNKLFQAGEDAIVFAFRRVGVISGYVIDRKRAQEIDTDKYDGTLFYQMYLTINVLKDMDALYIDETIVMCRNDIPPDFGHSAAEKHHFTPGEYTAASRLAMVSGILNIAKKECEINNFSFFNKILDDIAKYSFPILSRERQRGMYSFIKTYYRLGCMGLGRKIHFHAYFLLLLILGKKNSDLLVFSIKNKIGYTPNL